MIYELHGKIPQNSSFIYSEDVLTSTVFGNLRYFSSLFVLNSFLSKAIDLQGNNYSVNFPGKINFHFWEKYPSKTKALINEPDLILEDRNSVLIIECKYHSPLDETFSENESEYMNQLLRYSTIIDEYYPNKKNKNIIFLTLSDYNVKIPLQKTKQSLSKDIGLYWLRWEELLPILQQYIKSDISDNEKILVSDLIQFYLRRGLFHFEGIKINPQIFDWKYRQEKKYIFAKDFNAFSWRYYNE